MKALEHIHSTDAMKLCPQVDVFDGGRWELERVLHQVIVVNIMVNSIYEIFCMTISFVSVHVYVCAQHNNKNTYCKVDK